MKFFSPITPFKFQNELVRNFPCEIDDAHHNVEIYIISLAGQVILFYLFCNIAWIRLNQFIIHGTNPVIRPLIGSGYGGKDFP